MTPSLTERQARILDLLIHTYIETAQPVASAALARRRLLGVSPATVRHELAVLEEAGLLAQPHTSAGRVPTAEGLRFYVEHLMTRAGLPEAVQATIRRQFRAVGRDPERWMRLSAGTVARTSGAAGLVAREADSPEPRLYHAGLAQILDEPEFADHQRLRGVVEILEYGAGLVHIMALLPRRGVEVIIGGQPPLEAARDITLVLSRFGDAVRPAGVLGVVGPMRLPYDRAVPAVDFVADLMTQLLAGEAA